MVARSNGNMSKEFSLVELRWFYHKLDVIHLSIELNWCRLREKKSVWWNVDHCRYSLHQICDFTRHFRASWCGRDTEKRKTCFKFISLQLLCCPHFSGHLQIIQFWKRISGNKSLSMYCTHNAYSPYCSFCMFLFFVFIWRTFRLYHFARTYQYAKKHILLLCLLKSHWEKSLEMV